MRRSPVLFLLLFFLATNTSLQGQEKAPCPSIAVYFSPNGGCTEAIIREIDSARISILVQAYIFSSTPIAKALLNAHKRKVKIEVILDKRQRNKKYSSADFFANSGIPTKIDASHAFAHDKVILIDGEIVITGSFNFTESADEKNAENLLVIRDNPLAAKYIKNWRDHAGHSEAYIGR